jgi:hypothetical protein
VFFSPVYHCGVEELHPPPAQFLIAHKPGLFLSGPTGVLFLPLAKQW